MHRKHAKLTRPDGGQFHRNEFAIIGAPCGIIKELSQHLAKELKEFKVGFVDADHGSGDSSRVFEREYTDKISHHQISFSDSKIDFSYGSLFADSDLVLVNGNHFKAEKQIVLINEKKRDSLRKKLERMNNVLLFVLDEGEEDLHDYLRTEEYSGNPIVSITNVPAIAKVIRKNVKRASVKGLVLAGGDSMRMGQDKGSLEYHGKAQKEVAAELLSEFCDEVFYSLRVDTGGEKYPVISDTFVSLGSYGGILSAFQSDPNAAWLVLAADIPLMDYDTLKKLADNRDTSKVATCFHNSITNFPEPLITLWEPKAYPKMLYYLSQGYSCPRKVLINSEIEELNLDSEDALKNANTPEERDQLKKQITDKT